MEKITATVIEKTIYPNYASVEIHIGLNGEAFDVMRIREEAKKAIKDHYDKRLKDFRLYPVIEAFDLKNARIKAEVELPLEDNLLQGTEVKQLGREQVERIEFIVRKESYSSPNTISDLLDREM